jgi:hypothetical protein
MNNMTEENNENLHKADQVYFLYDPQPVRLLDVIYVGPVMIYAGIKGKNLNAFVKWSLIGVGICTILYNGANFFINEKKAMDRRRKEREEREQLKNFVPEPLTQEQVKEAAAMEYQNEDITDAVLENNLPEQVALEDLSSSDKVELPKEVLDILNQQQNETEHIVKKGRGRPNKKSMPQNLIENNEHSIQRS